MSSSPFISHFCASTLPFKFDSKPFYVKISWTLIKFDGSFENFATLIKAYYNCTMPTCCFFLSLVKSDFNSYMATFFGVASLVRVDRNFSIATSYIGLLSSTVSFKTFELKFNLSKKKLESFQSCVFF
jgi:hypothetical protein